MLGKRPRMRRTSSVSLIGSGSVLGDVSPLLELPKEKQKSSVSGAPRQVIGFHPKVLIDEDLDSSVTPPSPHPPHRTSPHGSPRSGLGDLLANLRPWDRKEGVGLGIVAALSSNQEEAGKVAEEVRGFPVPVGHSRKTSPMPSAFAPARASPPIPIVPHPNLGYHQNCAPAFGLMSSRQEAVLMETSFGGSRPNASNAWPRPGAYNTTAPPPPTWGHQADMEVDRNEPLPLPLPLPPLAPLLPSSRANVATSSSPGLNFLDACHLCRRRLGEGSDIYIYRGDKAFCSPECRHQQIVNDERPEKCSSAVMKMGGSDVRTTSQRNRVMAAGTAAAA